MTDKKKKFKKAVFQKLILDEGEKMRRKTGAENDGA